MPLTLGAALIALAATAPAALAVPACSRPKPVAPKFVVKGAATLESVIVDSAGRLYYTSNSKNDASQNALWRIDKPGAKPKVVIRNLDFGGGLAFEPKGTLLVGFGDSLANALNPNAAAAGLIRYDPKSGRSRKALAGLSMANGLARAKDGTIYASDDAPGGGGIDRVRPGHPVERLWAKVPSANGLAIDPSGRYLYANQTFTKPIVARVDLKTKAITTYAQSNDSADATAILDGMTSDAKGRLFLAANVGGAVWRVGTDRKMCSLAKGFSQPSAVALGQGKKGFKAGNVYAVTFHGDVIELPGAAK